MTVITDDFNRADAASLGANWREFSSVNNWGIVTNEAAPRTAAITLITDTVSVLDSDAQYVQARVRATVASAFHGVYLALSNTLGTSMATQGGGYVLLVAGAGQDSLSIRRKEALSGTLTTLTSKTQAVVAGDVLRLERDADGAMRAYFNDVHATILDVTDTTHQGSTFRHAGLGCSGTGDTALRYDDFEAGDQGGVTLQEFRPDADVTTTGWATTPLWSKVEEDPASDADFVTSTAV